MRLNNYLYDHLLNDQVRERFASDYESHVYYPRELILLFLHTGFEVETVFGDYRGRPLAEASRNIIVVGRRPSK